MSELPDYPFEEMKNDQSSREGGYRAADRSGGSGQQTMQPATGMVGIGAPQEDLATMVLVARRALQPASSKREIRSLAFSPRDEWIVAMALLRQEVPQAFGEPDTHTLYAWRARRDPEDSRPDDYATFKPIKKPLVASQFAFGPVPAGPGSVVVLCPYFGSQAGQDILHLPRFMPRLEVFGITPGPPANTLSRLGDRHKLPLVSPVAWSPDGRLVAATSFADKSRVVLVTVTKQGALKPGRVLPNFGGEVTHLAFIPNAATRGSADGSPGAGLALASAARDGVVRITDLETGRTLRKFEVSAVAHHPVASLLRVSPDGSLVASVWGREVMTWYPASGEARVYNLNAARQTEGWPLEISPDCRYLICRSEVGVDVSDLATGRFMGEALVDNSSFFTAAAFSWDSKLMAVGKQTGEVYVYDVTVVHSVV